MYDKVMVNLPYTVTIGDKTLQPGDYTIRELPSAAKSYVMLIYSDNGMKFETSALTIPTLDNNTPENTTVVLHHFGTDYYFDKIWIQGKNYGYEFPLPNSVKQRMREALQPVNVAATYQSVPAEKTETAQNTQPAPAPAPQAETPAPAPEPAPAPQPEATPAPAPAPEANREMPATSAGWLMMLLSGGALSGAGMMLRRNRG
jgi:cell division septation protein DedD